MILKNCTYQDETMGKSLEAFAATDFNENFSGRQPRQDVKVLRRFGHYSHPHLQGLLVVWWHLHILTWLSARETFIENTGVQVSEILDNK